MTNYTDCSAEFSAEYEVIEGFSVKCCRCGGNERVHNTSSFVGVFHADTMKCIGVLKARVAKLDHEVVYLREENAALRKDLDESLREAVKVRIKMAELENLNAILHAENQIVSRYSENRADRLSNRK